MKKLILSISVMALMLSCGTGENHNENSEDVTTEKEGEVKEIVEEESKIPEEIVYSSFDLLTEHYKNPESLLSSLKGNNVTIANILCLTQVGDMIRTIGYNGNQVSEYVDNESNSKVEVENEFMDDYNGEYLSMDLKNSTNSTSESIEKVEKLGKGDKIYDKFHSMITVKVNGDNIKTGYNSSVIEIDGATITEIKNF